MIHSSYRDIWNALLAIALVISLLFYLSSSYLAAAAYRVAKYATLAFSTATLLAFAAMMSGGLFVFGGRVNSFERALLLTQVISPVIMFFSLISVRWAAALMWVVALIVHAGYSSDSFPTLAGTVSILRFEWPLPLAAIMLSLVALTDKRRATAPTIIRAHGSV